jgi:hypothetical protein
MCFLLITVCILFSGRALGAPCRAKTFKQKISKRQVEAIQRSVSEGHQPWLLDAGIVAKQFFMESPDLKKARIDRSGLSLIQTLDSEQKAVFVYEDKQSAVRVEITLQRFEWLLSISQKWQWTIWTPTETRLFVCKAK